MAGESARESARRQREKARRLETSADLYERGAEGEQATADVLASLPRESWTVLHDLRWPGRPYANVDHVVVGPPGVFVIDSKNWSGTVTLGDGVLRQNGRSRAKAVDGAVAAAAAVGGLVPSVSSAAVQPVLCFVREELLSGSAHGVLMCSTANLRDMLLSRRVTMSADQATRAVHELRAGFVDTTPVHRRSSGSTARTARLRPSSRRTATPKKGSDASLGAVIRLALLVAVSSLAILNMDVVMAVVARLSELLAQLFVV